MKKTDSVIDPVEGNEFDCVEMKRKAQARIYEETKEMTLDELYEYWNNAFEEFQKHTKENNK